MVIIFRANKDLAKRIHLVFYEQLRLNTDYELAKIFDFSNLKYDRQILQAIIEKNNINSIKNKGEGKQVNKGSIGEWRNRLSSVEIQKCLEIGKKTLTEMGYKIDY